MAACLAQPVWGQGADDPPPTPSAPTRGPWRIQEVNFKGFDNISPSQALEVMETKSPRALQLKAAPIFNFLAMRRDEKRLVKLYEEYGFFQATVTAEAKRLAQSRTVIVTFEAHENDPTKIKDVQLLFPNQDIRQQWEERLRRAIPLKPGRRFVMSAYQEAKNQLNRILSDEAHPQNQVMGQIRVYAKEREAVIIFQIDPGPPILFGPTRLLGNKRVAKKYILRETTYVQGQPFSLKALKDTQRALLNTGFYVSATLEPQYQEISQGQVPIKLMVQERQPHSVRLGLGWGNEDMLRVRILQVNRNPLGLGDSLTFEGKISAIYEGLEGRWRLPRFPVRHAAFTLAGGLEQRENEAYVNRARFIRPRVDYKLGGPWSFFLGYNIERNTMVDIKAQVPDPAFEQQVFFISSFPAGFRYDSRDSILDPKKGTYFHMQVETALSAFGSELDFVRPVASISHVRPLPWLKKMVPGRPGQGGRLPSRPQHRPHPAHPALFPRRRGQRARLSLSEPRALGFRGQAIRRRGRGGRQPGGTLSLVQRAGRGVLRGCGQCL